MRTILAVDDDTKVLAAFEAALHQRGYRVFVTTSPLEVASILKQNKIDLVMLDVQMPEKNGFEIFGELKKKYDKLPVLFATAYPKSFTMQSDELVNMWKNNFADGNTDIMYKPFTLEALYQKVEGLIGGPESGGTHSGSS
jgi:DNA-binding response OmpR family regulator